MFKKLPGFVAPPFTRMGTNYERAKERVKEAVVLVLDSPKSFKDGKETYVDENNHNVAPKLIGDFNSMPFLADINVKNMSEAYMLKSPQIKTFGDDVLISYKVGE